MQQSDLIVNGEEALKVADALTSTSLRILQLVSQKSLDISEISSQLELSQPYISDQVSKLEEAKLVRVSYEKGRKGIKKLCTLAYDRIVIVVRP